MIIKERMSHPVKTVGPDMPVLEALKRMKQQHINRFPVVDRHGKMIGIVSKNDLLKASPSEATMLSAWEVNSLLEKITVKKVMSKNPITVTEDTVVEEAARIMVDNDVNGLPVMRNGDLVGIITDGNLFELFMEMLGARKSGIRVSVVLKEAEGMLYYLSEAIFKGGGNIVSLSNFLGESTSTREVVFKVTGMTEEALMKAIKPVVERVLYIHHMHV